MRRAFHPLCGVGFWHAMGEARLEDSSIGLQIGLNGPLKDED
jgi:hypothetical protein